MNRLLSPLLELDRLGWMRFVPVRPHDRRRSWPVQPWGRAALPREVDERLRTVPGIWRDAEAEEHAYEQTPLHDFVFLHTEAMLWALKQIWDILLPRGPRLARAAHRRAIVDAEQPTTRPPRLDPATATARIRAEAERLGISTVGFAPYDPKYAFAEYVDQHDRGTVIVCVLEQEFADTQTAPSARAERATFSAYAELTAQAAELASFVHALGYRAHPQSLSGEGVTIHYGVQAGLGQLGLNGQLLTRVAGSRVRLSLITTNAELEHGAAADFGVHAICDACQLCVRRCPVGAIPTKRAPYRGVTKAKIKTDRCWPVVAQMSGCAICMKVCPVQRYGLDAVTDHLLATGEILGKGTDELEGYTWPLDGQRYAAGEKPPIDSASLLSPPGWTFDGSRH